MKIRESGMPEKNMWEGFFSPAQILETLECNSGIRDAVEFGCGYGTFTIPAAKIISGKLFAFDIDPEMVAITEQAGIDQRVANIEVTVRDFLEQGTGLKPDSVDYAMLFNILHLENPVALLLEANRVLKNGGKVGIIHWNHDSATPRGPSMDIRPKPEDCIRWAEQAGFIRPMRVELKPYHYGVVLLKKERET